MNAAVLLITLSMFVIFYSSTAAENTDLDAEILLWHELKNDITQLRKEQRVDSALIKRLQTENRRLQKDVAYLKSAISREKCEKTSTKKRLRKRDARQTNDDDSAQMRSAEFLPDSRNQDSLMRDDRTVSIHLLDDKLGREADQQQPQESLKKLAEKFADLDAKFKIFTNDTENLYSQLQHLRVYVAQTQTGQYELKSEQKWLRLRLETLDIALADVEREQGKIRKMLTQRLSDVQAVGFFPKNTSGLLSNDDSSGETDDDFSSGEFETVKFAQPPSGKNREIFREILEKIHRASNDAYSISFQMKTKLDVLEEDLSNLNGRFEKFDSRSRDRRLQIENLLRNISVVDSRKDFSEMKRHMDKLSLETEKTRNLSQLVKANQVEHFTAMQKCKEDVNALETNLLRLGLKLTNFQADVLNSTLAACKESNKELNQDVHISNLHSRLDRIDGKFPEIHQTLKDLSAAIRTKAERAELRNIGGEMQKISEKMQKIDDVNDSVNALEETVGKLELQLPEDCTMSTVPWRAFAYLESSYLIKPAKTSKSIFVQCQMSDTDYPRRNWTIIQKRTAASSETFNRTWTEYRYGFGDARLPDSAYWLGNEYIHALTSKRAFVLRVDVWDIYDDFRFAEYDLFKVSSAFDDFRLTLGNYVKGNVSDALKNHHGMRFSSYDVDLDASSTHCARFYSSGWWFSNCHKANLNGMAPLGIIWFNNYTNDWIQLKKTVMKIRPKTETA